MKLPLFLLLAISTSAIRPRCPADEPEEGASCTEDGHICPSQTCFACCGSCKPACSYTCTAPVPAFPGTLKWSRRCEHLCDYSCSSLNHVAQGSTGSGYYNLTESASLACPAQPSPAAQCADLKAKYTRVILSRLANHCSDTPSSGYGDTCDQDILDGLRKCEGTGDSCILDIFGASMSCNKTSICASLSRVETFLERSRLNNCDRPTPRSSGSCSFLTILQKTPQVIAAAIVCTAKDISPITWMRCILNVVKDVGQECICSIVSKLPFETAPVFPQCEEGGHDNEVAALEGNFTAIMDSLRQVEVPQDSSRTANCPTVQLSTWSWSPANSIGPGWPGSACGLPINALPSLAWVKGILATFIEVQCSAPEECPDPRTWWGGPDPNCNPYISFFRRKVLCPTTFSPYSLTVPKVDNWMTDAYFTKQFLTGVNPLKIRKVMSIGELDSQLQNFLGKDTAEQLYMADYSELDTVAPPENGYKFYSPQVVWTFEGSELRLAAILLRTNQAGVESVLLSADTAAAAPNRWLFAKMHVLNADSQVHEWINHLPFHLMIECVSVATHNHLGTTHRIGRLLAPHMTGNVFIDWAAKRTLIRPSGSLAESMFAVGLKGALSLGGQFGTDFTNLDFPERMNNRGFPKEVPFPNYNFQVDGFSLWESLAKYIKAVVEDEYTSDSAVEGDTAIQAWVGSITKPEEGGLRGFPDNILTRESLSKTLTMIVFGASVFHQSINIPHFEYAYVPHRPTFLKRWMPAGSDDMGWQDLMDGLPTVEEHTQTYKVLNILGTHSECNLLSLYQAMSNEAMSPFKPLADLVAELESISEGIKKRFNSQDYYYLDPARVACSIDH